MSPLPWVLNLRTLSSRIPTLRRTRGHVPLDTALKTSRVTYRKGIPKTEYKKMEHLLKPRPLPFFYIREVVEPVKKARLDLWDDTAIAFRLLVNYMYVMLLGFVVYH